MKILVAGSRSFVGKNLSSYYSSREDCDLLFLSRDQVDLADSIQFADQCRNFMPDLVIHSAVSLDSTNNNLAMYLALERASQYYGKAIMIGSGAEYSHQRYKPNMPETYFSENHPPENNQCYHLSKHIISRIHQYSAKKNIYNFRVFGLFGPHEDYKRRLISNNIYNYLSKGVMQVNANHAFDYLYVKDLIMAIDFFASSNKVPDHKTYNVCTGRADRFFDILSEVVIELGGSKSDIQISSQEPTSLVYSGDPSRFQNEFDYKIERTTYAKASQDIKAWLQQSNLITI